MNMRAGEEVERLAVRQVAIFYEFTRTSKISYEELFPSMQRKGTYIRTVGGFGSELGYAAHMFI